MKLLSPLLLVLLLTFTSSAQLPVSPNAHDENNLRTGHWTILYDSAWKELKDQQDATYYRLITFENGKPKGKVRDFYKSGQKQWDGYLLDIDPDVFDGEARMYYQNGVLKSQSFYKDRVLNGIYREYTNKGVLIIDGFYEDGKLVGKYKSYHENGNLYYDANMKDGLMDGDLITYFDTGAEQGRGKMEKGVKTGLWEFRHQNGKTQSKAYYVEGELNGMYEEYDENGVLSQTGLTKHGFRDGHWAFYYPDGTLKQEGEYDFEKGQYGVWREYNEEGILKSEGPMVEGLKEGKWTFYMPDRSVSSVGEYHSDRKEGPWIFYHPNKVISASGVFVSDLREGKWMYYYDNGNIQTDGAYHEDVQTGPWIFYYSNGSKTCEGTYVAGNREGPWKYYDTEGNITLHDHLNDLAHGIAIKYFTDGSVSEKFNYDSGKLHGAYTTYYKGGQLKSVYNYDHDVYHGICESYFADGKLYWKANYDHGQLHGPYIEYHSNAKVFKRGTYNMGARVVLWEEFFASGQLAVRRKYKNGKYTWLDYYENGMKKSEGEGITKDTKDLPDGYQVHYFHNGTVNTKGININGQPEGKYVYYDSITRKKITEGTYANGLYNGLWRWYDEKGKVTSESYFVDGFRETADNISDSITHLLQKQNYDLAFQHINWFKRVLQRDVPKTDPKWAIFYKWLGEIYINTEDYEKALTNYTVFRDETKRLESDSAYNYVLALNGIANSYSKLRKFEDSYQINTILVEQSDQDSDDRAIYLYNRAINLKNLGRVEDGIKTLRDELLRREMTFGKNSPKYLIMLELVASYEYYDEENYDNAIEHYKTLLSLVDRDDNRYLESLRMLSTVYYGKNNTEESISWLEKAIEWQRERNMDSFFAYYDDMTKLASRYVDGNNYAKGLQVLQEAIQSLPKHDKVVSYEAAMLLYEASNITSREIFDYKTALMFAEKAKVILEQINRTHADLYGNVLYAIGMCSNQDPLTAHQAEEYYRRTVEFNRQKYGDQSTSYLTELISIAGYFTGSYKFAKADSTLKLAEKTILTTVGDQHWLYASCHKSFGDMYILEYKYHDAVSSYSKYIGYYKTRVDEYPKFYASGLKDLAYVYDVWSNYEKSEQYIQEALKVYEEHKLTEIAVYVDTQISLANNLSRRFLYNESIEMYQKAIAGYKKILGEEHSKYRGAIFDLAKLYVQIKEHSLGEQNLKLCTDLTLKVSGSPADDTYYQMLEKLGEIYAARRDFQYASYYYELAREAGLPYRHTILYAFFLQRYGEFCHGQNQYTRAEQLVKEATETARTIVGENHWFFAVIAINLSKIYRSMGKLAEAEKMIQLALLNAETNKVENPGSYITAVTNLVQVYRSMGRYEEAEKLHKTILAYVEETDGKRKWYGIELLNISQLYLDWGRYTDVKSSCQEALSIFEETLSPDHEDVLNGKLKLGLANLFTNHPDSAFLYFSDCKRQREINGKTNTEQHAIVLENLATVEILLNRIGDAEKDFQQSVATRKENKLETSLINEANLLANGAILYQNMNRRDLAEKYWHETLDKVMIYIRSNFPFMSDYEKAKFWERNKKHFEYFNTFATLRQADDQAILGEMYNYRLATKGILLSASNKVRKRIYASRDSLLIHQYHHWTELREQVAKVYARSASQEKTPMIDSLEQIINSLEKELSLSSDEGKEDRERLLNWRDVQRALSPGEAAIEFIRYRHFENQLTDSVVYAALILTPETKVAPKIVIFPHGDYLEGKAYRYYRNSIATQSDDNLSYKNYWEPIEKVVANKKVIYLSLDGVFNQVNMKTLKTADGNYLMEKKDFVIVSNTRDLVAMKARKKIRLFESASLIGNPKFFLGSAGSGAPAKTRATDDLDRGAIAELPGTGVEVETIETLLRARGWKVNALLEADASEDRIKHLPSSRVLHFATHGFFREANGGGTNLDPMLRSGILLTGAGNFIQQHTESAGGENGILTAFEAANLSLEGTELVVLSACETARGEIQQGEGVYGLQRAFITAGAESLIMSLWKVDDEATKRLMSLFYENWMNGMDKSAALNAAQQTIMKTYPHPYYWGAFVMIKG